MAVLTPQQRNTLESAVKLARKAAEQGAFNALHGMAVDHHEPFTHMNPGQRNLRNILRSKARLLGDKLPANGAQEIDHLGYELAYETWHKMLFAKFLEVNDLLMHPDGVAVTMEDCEELAKDEGFIDKWDAAANYASKMVPAIFRTDDPLMQVTYATDERIKLEEIIDALENEIFMADDALGWVYQFWQSEAKAAINASGVKIDGAKLPAVTQLFTEPYMVNFLIDNTLGAWWVSRNPGVKPPIKFEYLRVVPASSRNNSKGDDINAISTSSGSSNQYEFFSKDEEIDHIKGNLPHWRQEGKIYFVTFRTADSMPQEKLMAWQEELDRWNVANPKPWTDTQRKEYYSKFPAKMQEYLDNGYGACHLKMAENKAIVENALRFFDGERYILDEFVVAANHVHVMVRPLGDNQLSNILHSWKSFTANEINKVIGETGAFWQKESYDHLVRSEASLEKFRNYIKNHSIFLQQDNLRQDGGATLVPAAGKFEGWPDKTAEITSLDPCMGSGHFVASLFPVFAALRMHEEGLTKEQATDKVIAENLHGLELDARCTQIAAFNLALTAWKFCGHYKELPEMNLACSGIAPKGKVEDWVKLVGKVDRADDKERLENGMRMLYDHFQLAPELGSLLDPTTIKADAFTASFEELQPVLKQALENEADSEQLERGVMAAGIAKSGEILAQEYTLQITNVPYLGIGRLIKNGILYNYCLKNYPEAKGDLANVFLEKMLKSNTIGGISCSVMPQNWLFQPTYKKYREKLLESGTWHLIARLGSGAFSQISGEVVKAILMFISNQKPSNLQIISGLDVSDATNATTKGETLKANIISRLNQLEQLKNPDSIITIEKLSHKELLGKHATCIEGLSTGDNEIFVRNFWEIGRITSIWTFFIQNVNESTYYGGRTDVLLWENGKGVLKRFESAHNFPSEYMNGFKVLGNQGIRITQMTDPKCTLYTGEIFGKSAGTLILDDISKLPAVWCYSNSNNFIDELKKINQSLYRPVGTFLKVPFDLDHWQKVATEKYPHGLPKPYSDDPTQWLFHGHPIKTNNPLQVALARVLGYRWPAETDTEMELADEARELIEAVKAFDHLSDDDGIFCIPSVNAEDAGAERLRDYLQQVFAKEWNNQTITQLLQKEGSKSTNLEAWLRDEFFAQHCKVFKNRPFIWHIWDGRKDGFSALVNYHKLNKENLSKLIYTYLGDWIRMCEAKKKAGESGAEGLLSAAQKLKENLEAILTGEAPYDIFVRWKPLKKQPIGWEPDLNDGVRLNIRPFVEAGVLRNKFNVKWGVDRGKNPPGSPWGEIRVNDRHLSLEEKRNAREI